MSDIQENPPFSGAAGVGMEPAAPIHDTLAEAGECMGEDVARF